MNRFVGYARPVCGGYHAMLRTARDGEPKPLLGKGGREVIFATRAEALEAVVARLTGYLNSTMRRDGVTVGRASGEVEKVFGRVGR